MQHSLHPNPRVRNFPGHDSHSDLNLIYVKDMPIHIINPSHNDIHILTSTWSPMSVMRLISVPMHCNPNCTPTPGCTPRVPLNPDPLTPTLTVAQSLSGDDLHPYSNPTALFMAAAIPSSGAASTPSTILRDSNIACSHDAHDSSELTKPMQQP